MKSNIEIVTVVESPIRNIALKDGPNPIFTSIIAKIRLDTVIISWVFFAMTALLFNESRKQNDIRFWLVLLHVGLIMMLLNFSFFFYNMANGSFTWYEKSLLKNSAKDSLLPFFDKNRLDFIKPQKNKLLEIHRTHDGLSAFRRPFCNKWHGARPDNHIESSFEYPVKFRFEQNKNRIIKEP